MSRRPKNILLITTDEQRADAVGFAGNTFIRTPNLDALAAEAVQMSRHSCSTPICTPARSSLLTGRYPQSHGAVDCGYLLPRETPTLATWLADAGLVTGICGKLHLEPECSNRIENLHKDEPYFGFQHFNITEDVQRGEYLDWVRTKYPHLYDEVRANTLENDAGGGAESDAYVGLNDKLSACYTSKLPDEVHPTRWITDRSLEFISQRERDEKPWFLWVSYVDPHHPWNPIEPWASMYDPEELPAPDRTLGAHGGPSLAYNDGTMFDDQELKRMVCAYYAMISHIDHHVGRVIDRLRSSGELDETLVIFTSDHGDYNGSRGMIRKRAGLYEDILRVPMLCRIPGAERAGTNFNCETQHEDIAPTVLEALGLQIPGTVEGHSFLGVIQGKTTPSRTYSYFYNPIPVAYGIADGQHKLVSYPETREIVLTEIGSDPGETVNRLNTRVEVANQLKLELCNWLTDTPVWRPAPSYDY